MQSKSRWQNLLSHLYWDLMTLLWHMSWFRVILKLNYPEAKECPRRRMFLKFSTLSALFRSAHQSGNQFSSDSAHDSVAQVLLPANQNGKPLRHHSSGLFSRVGFNGMFDFCQHKCYWWLSDLSLHCSGWEATTITHSRSTMKSKIHYTIFT